MTLKRSTQTGFASDPPFKKAKVKVSGITTENRTGQFAKADDVDIILNLTNVQVLETDSPFPYKTSELRLRDSAAVNSRKGIFEASIDACLGETADSEGSPILKVDGKEITIEREDNYLFFTNRKTGTESRGTVWRVISIEGKTATDPMQDALSLLEGKTKAQFVVDALTKPNISRDTALQSSLLDDTFFTRKEVTDGFQVDAAGVYHRK